MKLKNEFVKLPKDMVYDTYLSLVYDAKDYDNITRAKMLESILKEYNQENYLYYICTERELAFLKYAYNKKLDVKDIEKYEWEINELNKKCIFSNVTFEVFEEQKINVENALKFYGERSKKYEDEIVIFMIGFIKTNAQMLTKPLIQIIQSMFNVTEKQINNLFGHPLFHFYCGFYEKWFEFLDDEEEVVYYRSYWDRLDEINAARKEYGLAGGRDVDVRDYYDIFYYGWPIKNAKVKKMYDEVSKRNDKQLIFDLIDFARVLNDRYALNYFIKDEKLVKTINEALDEIPCAVMNGFTPNEYQREKVKEIDLKKIFTAIPQNNAHLCKNAADEFYKLYFALLEYVNNKEKISPNLKKIYKQEGLDVNELVPIDEYLWQHKELIDQFTDENKYKFTDEELEIIKGFKSAITSEAFVIVGFEREYTKILSEDGKVYMVKGIRADFDELIDPSQLPVVISTTLLMFKNNIIFNSFFSSMPIAFGNDMKEAILKEYNEAITYYHL